MSAVNDLARRIENSLVHLSSPEQLGNFESDLKRSHPPLELAGAVASLISNRYSSDSLYKRKAQCLLEVLEYCFRKLSVSEVLEICNAGTESKQSVDWVACKALQAFTIPPESARAVEDLALRFLARPTAAKRVQKNVRRNIAAYGVLQKIGGENALKALGELRHKFGQKEAHGTSVQSFIETLDSTIADIEARLAGNPLPSEIKRKESGPARANAKFERLKQQSASELWSKVVGKAGSVGKQAALAIEHGDMDEVLPELGRLCKDRIFFDSTHFRRCLERIGKHCSPGFVLCVHRTLAEYYPDALSSIGLVQTMLRESSRDPWAEEFVMKVTDKAVLKYALHGFTEEEKNELPQAVSLRYAG